MCCKVGSIPAPQIKFLCVCVCVLVQLNLTELRTFPNPPAIVTNVSAAVLVLLSPQGRIPKDRSWKASKMVMSKVIFYSGVSQINVWIPQKSVIDKFPKLMK